jgi:predicted metal-dependent hydrolase
LRQELQRLGWIGGGNKLDDLRSHRLNGDVGQEKIHNQAHLEFLQHLDDQSFVFAGEPR